MKNRLVLLIMIVFIMLGLTACNNKEDKITNLGFEKGNFNEWTIEGDAFSLSSKVYFGNNQRYYFNEGTYHVLGSISKIGSIKSKAFKVSKTGYVSFLIGGSETNDTYIGVYDAKTGKELAKTNNEYYDEKSNTENYLREVLDLSEYLNTTVYIKVVDSSTNDYINVDDFVVDIDEELLTELMIDKNVRLGLDTYDDMIKAANTYIKQNSYKIRKEDRFKYHVTGEMGWINDPNGFSYYDGKINLFYQHNPYDVKWGPMHWGHVTSTDFVKWNYESIALAPDKDYDYIGAFSGSAIEFNGKYYLVYTGASDGKQVQCLAVSDDGINFTKYEGNPIIDERQLPANTSIKDFRDPKVWIKDGTIYMIVSARNTSNQYSKLLLFKSNNMYDWTYAGRVIANNSNLGEKLGIMFECPDIFELNGKSVVIVSSQSVSGHRNSDSNVYIVGDLSYQTGNLDNWSYESILEIDNGFDFYAPQTMEMNDGRRIMVAWMASWNRTPIYSSIGLAGAMTFPRELTLVDNHLYQAPVREISNYYFDNYSNIIAVNPNEKLFVPSLDGFYQDITMEFTPNSGKTGITVFADENGKGMKIYYQNGRVYLERYGVTDGYYSQTALFNVTSSKTKGLNKVKIRLLLDRYSVEVFIDDGYSAMTATGFPINRQNKTYLFSDNPVSVSIIKNNIKLD